MKWMFVFEGFQCRFMLVGRLGTPEAAVAGGSLPPNDVCRMSQPFTLPLPVIEAVTIMGDFQKFLHTKLLFTNVYYCLLSHSQAFSS